MVKGFSLGINWEGEGEREKERNRREGREEEVEMEEEGREGYIFHKAFFFSSPLFLCPWASRVNPSLQSGEEEEEGGGGGEEGGGQGRAQAFPSNSIFYTFDTPWRGISAFFSSPAVSQI